MSQAAFQVTVAGTNISATLIPVLMSITVQNRAGKVSDTASIEVDDRDGRIVMPKAGAAVQIALGWQGGDVRQVFSGTVDEVKSSGDRGSGRRLTIGAKGFASDGRAKEGQNRHFDQMTVGDILAQAGSIAGIVQTQIDPAIAGIVIPYVDMRGESLLHLGQRLARMVGASFRVQGTTMILARRGADYTAGITAAWGVNLISWDISPVVSRGKHGKARTQSYDLTTGQDATAEAPTQTPDAVAATVQRDQVPPDMAEIIAQSNAAVASEMTGVGRVVIEGAPSAIPDAVCTVVGARPGVDGAYRIKGVTHELNRGSGFLTTLELAQPHGSAGADTRGAASGTTNPAAEPQ